MRTVQEEDPQKYERQPRAVGGATLQLNCPNEQQEQQQEPLTKLRLQSLAARAPSSPRGLMNH